jgi:glycosyltransferase involved in cell wall biosynthesis
MPSISVIISTYNKPKFLEKVLTGYTHQSFKDFEIIIADDGSGVETKNIIQKFNRLISQDIIHVWHKDDGFRKCKILNEAITKSANEYLVFSDGDCIPNRQFLATHNNLAKTGYFLSGGHFPINEKVSDSIKITDIESEHCFNKSFILKNGQPLGKNFFKLIKNSFLAKCLDQITPTRTTFNGNNSSAWRHDIILVNGFDERMEYGGLDCELGYRLNNNGIKSIQIRNRATVIHLYHTRPYKNEKAIKKNRLIRQETLSTKITKTDYGITK